MSSLLNLSSPGQLAGAGPVAEETEYRALVCLFFAGGNDSFNMLAPYGDAEHQDYLTRRGFAGLAKEQLLELDYDGPSQTRYGVHEKLPFLKSEFDASRLAFVANTGTLVRPIASVEEFESGILPVPRGLFSHSDQTRSWQSSLPDIDAPKTGWGGRLADILDSANQAGNLPMNISVGGGNLFQTGQGNHTYVISPGGPVQLGDFYNDHWKKRRQAVEALLENEYENLFKKTYRNQKQQAIETQLTYQTALLDSEQITVPFSADNLLSSQFQQVARTIAARDELGVCRQTFYVQLGGFDTHADLLVTQASLLEKVNQAMEEFVTAIQELGLENQVTIFNASDFARTLTPNGAGSDHGWGGNYFVWGGGVQGKKIYGEYPAIVEDNPLDTGRGQMIPTTSTDEYFAELALWMGATKAQLPDLFPNLEHFHDVEGNDPPLGFMDLG
ncbi:DUF1501 domain-containing protein [bacterium]|nr:DUF1501 domain-containing protein [bacterium]